MLETNPIFEFEVVNLKLQTKKSDAEKLEAYKAIILKLVELKCHSAVSENQHLIMYSAYQKKTETGIEYIYGRLGKGIYFDNKNGRSLDIESSTTEEEEYDTSKLYNPDYTDYVFIPSAHRLCVQLGNKITASQVRRFLISNASQVIQYGDKIAVEIQKEETAISELLTAKKVHKLDYSISYTNDDTLGAAASLFDRRLKRSQIGKVNVKAEADHNDYMNIEGEEILEGGIELAKGNGNINSAEITTSDGERKTVTTKDKAKRIKIQSDYESFRTAIVNRIMLLFRNEE
ncbi:DUF4747 family protein [uncultured Draconibacterium sp.]|uniref:DUF4747 family protein n=1 Tax=uncultured Draconibacterium sp. TaxID=1573823 RepID=UPI00261D3E41|nr:DUF4747 family protein [uncultured Draconibacterium sp.]